MFVLKTYFFWYNNIKLVNKGLRVVRVEFLGPINKKSMDLDISNLDELSKILKNDDEVSTWLETCAIAHNDTLISSKSISLKDGDKISLLPPVCGG